MAYGLTLGDHDIDHAEWRARQDHAGNLTPDDEAALYEALDILADADEATPTPQ